MPFLRHSTVPATDPLPDPQHPPTLLGEGENTVEFEGFDGARTPQARKSHFQTAAKRKTIMFGPEDVLEADFCHSFLQFPELYLALPGGLRFDLKKYWDGRPVRFVCCERAKDENTGRGEVGKIFWMVELTVLEADAAELEEGHKEAEEDEESDDSDSRWRRADSRMRGTTMLIRFCLDMPQTLQFVRYSNPPEWAIDMYYRS